MARKHKFYAIAVKITRYWSRWSWHVGKTSIAEGLAWLIVNGKAPKHLANAEVYSLDIGGFGGRTNIVVTEKRLETAFEQRWRNQKQFFVYWRNPHDWLELLAQEAMGSVDASNLIKPALANGATLYWLDLHSKNIVGIWKDHALSRRFQKIDVNEPSISETVDILRGLKSKFEEFHHVKYDDKPWYLR